MLVLKSLLKEKAKGITQFFFDVDGVMTPQGRITIYDVSPTAGFPCFERRDGTRNVRLVPCDEYGVPLKNVLEYYTGNDEELIMEGYQFDPRDGKVIEYLVEHFY